MQPEEIRQRILRELPDCEVSVDGGDGHFQATVVGDCFEGQSPVQRQKRVNATVFDLITSGAVHAFTIRAHTPAEWARASKLRIG